MEMDGQHEQGHEQQQQQQEQQQQQQERNKGGRKQVKNGTTRRNARERNRVRHINACFDILREHIPHERHNKKLSKVDTLKSAMNYIEDLHRLLLQSTTTTSSPSSTSFIFPLNIKQEDLFYWHSQDHYCLE